MGSVAAAVKVQNKLKAAVVFKTDFGEEKKVKPIFKTYMCYENKEKTFSRNGGVAKK